MIKPSFEKTQTTLTSTGTTDFVPMHKYGLDSAWYELVVTGGSSAVVIVEYSNNGSTVAAYGETKTITVTPATTYLLNIEQDAYPYVRLNFSGGTATSIVPTVKGQKRN